jgi:hypothetical protein
MAFSAAGFFGQINNDITDQKQYIRARVEEDRLYLREQGLKRQGAIQEQRGQYEQAARSLITRGADERRVLATLEMDPQGLMEVFRRTDNNNDITGNNLNDMMSIAADYQGEASMDDVLNSILPTIQEMPNDTDPVTSRRRSIASWLGLDVDEAMTNQVYSQQIVGGMTGDQIMAGMNLPVQAQGSNVGGVSFDFSALGSGNNLSASDVSTHIRTINEELSIDGEVARLNQLINPEAGLPRPTTEETTSYMADIAALEEADSRSGANRINALLAIPGVEPGATTRMLIGLHGENLFSNTNGFNNPSLSILLGTSLTEDTSEAAVNASGDPAVDPNGVVETATTPEVETSALDPEVDLDTQFGVNESTPALNVTTADLQSTINNVFANPNAKEAYAFSVDGSAPFVVTIDDVTEEGDTAALEAQLLGAEPALGETVDTVLSRSALSRVSPASTPEETLRKRGASEEEIQSILASTGGTYIGPSADAEAQRAAWIEEQSWINPRGTWSEFFSGMTTESQSRGTAPRAMPTSNPVADDSRANIPAGNQSSVEESGVSIEEAIADQQMLQAAFTSDEISREELNTMIQNFEGRYGEDALFIVLNEATALPAPTVNPVADDTQSVTVGDREYTILVDGNVIDALTSMEVRDTNLKAQILSRGGR